MEVAIGVGVFLVLLALGTPIWVSLISGASLGIVLSDITLVQVTNQMFVGMNSFILTAVPLYILVGNLMARSQMADDLISIAEASLGNFRAGLAHANVGASVVFAGISGAAVADAAALGKIFVPYMERNGYSASFAGAITAASSVLGPIIPPSVIIIIYASVVDASIAELFAAGIVPGLVIASVLFSYNSIHEKRAGRVKPKRSHWRSLPKKVLRGLPALVLPIIILGSIFQGWFTPTEAAAAGCVYALIVWPLFRRSTFTKTQVAGAFADTVKSTSAIMLIVAAATVFSWLLTLHHVQTRTANAITNWTSNVTVYLAIMVLICLVMGTILNLSANIIVLGPLLVPVGVALGGDPTHVAMVFIISLTFGLLTPPLGMVVYAVSSVTSLEASAIFRALAPIYGFLILALVLLVAFPDATTIVPQMLGL